MRAAVPAPVAGSAQRRLLARVALAREFSAAVIAANRGEFRATALGVLQVNVGKLCNQTCRHCHVDAGPHRTEVMSRETLQLCLEALDASRIPWVDITGGAPELNPDFRWFAGACASRGLRVSDRCNLTILETPAGADLPEFLASHRIEVIASLPHYRQPATDAQRGDGVFERSLSALRKLNAVGYGDGSSGLRLTLVTNPVGAFLPSGQTSLESEWKREMDRRYGIRFDSLYTITNMPISRFLAYLLESGNLDDYLQSLANAFNPAAAAGVMCRTMVSVGWDGTLYDCDFNQMLDLELLPGVPRHIRDFDVRTLATRRIATARHCFGCTAGAGSSCGGAIA